MSRTRNAQEYVELPCEHCERTMRVKVGTYKRFCNGRCRTAWYARVQKAQRRRAREHKHALERAVLPMARSYIGGPGSVVAALERMVNVGGADIEATHLSRIMRQHPDGMYKHAAA